MRASAAPDFRLRRALISERKGNRTTSKRETAMTNDPQFDAGDPRRAAEPAPVRPMASVAGAADARVGGSRPRMPEMKEPRAAHHGRDGDLRRRTEAPIADGRK